MNRKLNSTKQKSKLLLNRIELAFSFEQFMGLSRRILSLANWNFVGNLDLLSIIGKYYRVVNSLIVHNISDVSIQKCPEEYLG